MLKNRARGRDPALCGFCKCSHGIGWKLEAWLTGSEFVLSLEPQASCLKLISALADGRMLVFQHPVRSAHRRPVPPVDDSNDKKVALKLQ
jgi:hypothetical protein